MPRERRIQLAAFAAGLSILLAQAALAEGQPSSGQTVYVPIYSEVPYGDQTGMLLVRASVVVRNVDPSQPLTIESVAYHHTDGHRIAEYIETPLTRAPLAARAFDVRETDTKGGPAPAMLVRWRAAKAMNAPVIEGLMISTFEKTGVSFRTEGRVLTLPTPSR